MNNMNIDENTMNNIKNMVDSGNISEAISNISPEMIQNFSKMLSTQETQSNINHTSTENNSNTQTNNNSFDFSNIDMNTIKKMSSIMGKMNNPQNDPRANLLNSLKPYLREEKKGKLDNYMNLLNVTKIAEIMKDLDKENNSNV